MSKIKVYDERVEINVIRNGKHEAVMFSDVEDGDVLVDYPGKSLTAMHISVTMSRMMDGYFTTLMETTITRRILEQNWYMIQTVNNIRCFGEGEWR